ncbi:DinB family protein [Arthrobacter sp. AQ5-05]|uniref:maleylpyruvate isomerase family mycothiol-dependent enzyme n=1 Tax=Arthrobacter sp. AQ5-05 TaxID=2184581 RepID=UPI000DCB455D|nr:maleylpyruvate isomerase family mycothiol-dependent enzyme [Arthrobacter sp. AQ5-05]RAX48808.1 DinB family protein [Arthrobacter sp. AQ5-05]
MNDMGLAQAERIDLADFLEGLTPGQWEAPSLCAQWRVRDVVAHVVSYDDLGAKDLLRRFAKGRVVHANQVGVDAMKDATAAQLLDNLRAHARPSGLAAGLGGKIGLADGMIHHQDIRRPLGMPRQIPVDRLLRVLAMTPGNPRLAPWRWIRGLRLVATDMDFAHGKGPEAAGTGEALLMAMAGRRGIAAELRGPGQPILAGRLERR